MKNQSFAQYKLKITKLEIINYKGKISIGCYHKQQHNRRGNMKYHSNIKKSFEYGLVKEILYNLVLSVFMTLVLAVLMIKVLNLRMDIVLSDSMAPTFHKHDIVVVMKQDAYKENDIIEFKQGKAFVTHRIINVRTTNGKVEYNTKGDNNQQPEEYWVDNSIIQGKVIGIFTDGEHVYDFFKNNYFLLIDLILGIWVLTSTINGESEMRKHNIAKV